jgi:glutamate/tyrosine decarboxylase-like PLP-dependent enzyme
MLEKESVRVLGEALEKLDAGFASLPENSVQPPGFERMAEVLSAAAEKLQDNFPYFHPLYAGQMLKPPHPVARSAYALAQWINPNNHALDGGRASSEMEKEAVGQLARMFGWTEHLGHLTSGGTMANLEALWVLGQLAPKKTILASEQAHYTHKRISGVLGLPFEAIPCDPRGRMDVNALEKRLAQGDVGAVVATIGTTATGSVDPLKKIVDLCKKHHVLVHADAAYGGYFTLAGNLTGETRDAFDCLGESHSIVIDPHKHGLQPYGCGCVIFHDSGVGRLYKHESPYTYFTSNELHLGEISLECSRAGASAVALWSTQKLLPLVRNGEFANGLESCREAALDLHRRLRGDRRFITAFPPELDIVVFGFRATSVSEASVLTRKAFDAAAKRNLHLAIAELPTEFFAADLSGMKRDRPTLTCLRSVLMKPEHREWVGRIWAILDEATREAVSS